MFQLKKMDWDVVRQLTPTELYELAWAMAAMLGWEKDVPTFPENEPVRKDLYKLADILVNYPEIPDSSPPIENLAIPAKDKGKSVEWVYTYSLN